MTEPAGTPRTVYLARREVASRLGIDPAEVTLRPDAFIHGQPAWLASRVESPNSSAEPARTDQMNNENNATQVYRGLITITSHGEDDAALKLSDDNDPLAERIETDLDEFGRYATVRYWISDTERTADELADNLAKVVTGALDADYTQAYSEITGYLWTDADIKVGGHDLLAELESHVGKFAHLEITYSTEPAPQ